MRHHAMVQGANRVASPRQAEPWEKTMHETGEGAPQHPGAESEGGRHVLQVGLVDCGGMVGEATQHLHIVGASAENGLLPCREPRKS